MATIVKCHFIITQKTIILDNFKYLAISSNKLSKIRKIKLFSTLFSILCKIILTENHSLFETNLQSWIRRQKSPTVCGRGIWVMMRSRRVKNESPKTALIQLLLGSEPAGSGVIRQGKSLEEGCQRFFAFYDVIIGHGDSNNISLNYKFQEISDE